jgi:hypothetical protein
MELICDCDKWKRSADQIIGAQVEQALNHNMITAQGEELLIRGCKYTGDKWRFCPWCGLVLVAAQPATPADATCTCGHLWSAHNDLGCCWDDECPCSQPRR